MNTFLVGRYWDFNNTITGNAAFYLSVALENIVGKEANASDKKWLLFSTCFRCFYKWIFSPKLTLLFNFKTIAHTVVHIC